MNTLESNVFLDPEDTTPERMLAPELDHLSQAEMDVVEEGVAAALESMAILDQYRVVREHLMVNGINAGYALERDQEMPELNLLDAMYGVASKQRVSAALEGVGQNIRATFIKVRDAVIKALMRVVEIIKTFFNAFRTKYNSLQAKKVPMNQYGKKGGRELDQRSKELIELTKRTSRISDVFNKYIKTMDAALAKNQDKQFSSVRAEMVGLLQSHLSGCNGLERAFFTTTDTSGFETILGQMAKGYDETLTVSLDAVTRLCNPALRDGMLNAARDLYRLNTGAMQVLEKSKNQAVGDIIMTRRFPWESVVELEPGIGADLPQKYAELRDVYQTKQLALRLALADGRGVMVGVGKETRDLEQQAGQLAMEVDLRTFNVEKFFQEREKALVSLSRVVENGSALDKHADNVKYMGKAVGDLYSTVSKGDSQLPDGTNPDDGEFYNLVPGDGNDVEPVYEDYYDSMSDIGIATTQLSMQVLEKLTKARQLQGLVIESGIGLATLRLRLVKKLRQMEKTLHLEGAGLELHDSLEEQVEGLLAIRQKLFS